METSSIPRELGRKLAEHGVVAGKLLMPLRGEGGLEVGMVGHRLGEFPTRPFLLWVEWKEPEFTSQEKKIYVVVVILFVLEIPEIRSQP